MMFHSEPAKMIDHKRRQEGRRHRQPYKGTRPDSVDQSQSRVHLHRSDQPPDDSPPRHAGQVLRRRQWMWHHEKKCREEKRNHRERHCRSEPRIHNRLVELAVHRRTAGLQSAAQYDEGNDPTGVHVYLLACRTRWLLRSTAATLSASQSRRLSESPKNSRRAFPCAKQSATESSRVIP